MKLTLTRDQIDRIFEEAASQADYIINLHKAALAAHNIERWHFYYSPCPPTIIKVPDRKIGSIFYTLAQPFLAYSAPTLWQNKQKRTFSYIIGQNRTYSDIVL